MSGPSVAPEPVTALTSAAHAYFDFLSARTECMVAYSLRDMDQLLTYMDATHRPIDVSYDPQNDPDPRRQDAAKIVVPANVVSLPNNVRVPIPPVGDDTLLVTWDAWMGREFAYAATGIGNYKHFQFTSGRIWTEVKADFDNTALPAGALAAVQVRLYGQEEDGMIGPNITNRHPLSPAHAEFATVPEIWTRYWAYFKKVGEWHEFSLWLADETRDPVLVIDRRLIKPNTLKGYTGWTAFWLQYNSSTTLKDGQVISPRVSYVRNVAMLKGVTDVPQLLERPAK